MINTAQVRTIRSSESVAGRQTSIASDARIVAILPRGEAIRNFVYTGALDEAAGGIDVTLLSVLPNEEVAALLKERYGDVIPLLPAGERWAVRLLRELLDMAHGRWLWSEAAAERWRLRDLEAAASGSRLKRSLKKLGAYPFANAAGLELLSGLEKASSRLLRTTDEYRRLFKELKPSLVFNGSHVHSDVAAPAVRAAQWLGIPTAAFIFSWDNLTSQGRIIPQYDYYLVWNEGLRNQLLGMYRSIRRQQVFVTGTPQFDFHFRPEFHWTRERFCNRVGADPSRPIVLYTTGMANHMPGEPAIVEQIASMLREMTDRGAPQLLVRVYPKDQTGRFDDLKRRYPEVLMPAIPWESNWLTPLLEDSYLLTNMLRHSAVCINVASTTSLEMCMFDKPVINIGYNPPDVDPGVVEYARYYEFDHYRPIVESGAVEVSRSEEHLRQALIEALSRPGERAIQRRALIRQIFGNNLDGWSSTRVASVLDMLASRKQHLGRLRDSRLSLQS